MQDAEENAGAGDDASLWLRHYSELKAACSKESNVRGKIPDLGWIPCSVARSQLCIDEVLDRRVLTAEAKIAVGSVLHGRSPFPAPGSKQ